MASIPILTSFQLRTSAYALHLSHFLRAEPRTCPSNFNSLVKVAEGDSVIGGAGKVIPPAIDQLLLFFPFISLPLL